MKFLAIALMLAATATSANAATVTADVGAESSFIYRGVDLSKNDDFSLNGSVRVQDAFVPGFYLRGQVNSVNQNGYQVSSARTDAGIGYARTYGPWNYDVSVNRVFNPVIYNYDYTEARGMLGYNVTKSVMVYGEVDQQVGRSADNDTFGSLGVAYSNAFTVPNLKLSAAVGANRFSGGTSYNNTEVAASYLIRNRVAVYGKYSFGGSNRFGDLGDVGTVGVRFLF